MASATPRLSIGSLLRFIRNGTNGSEKAHLQVLAVKAIDNKSDDGMKRYRIMLSDGRNFFSACMLQTQLNSLVESGELKEHSIVRVDRCLANTVDKSSGKTILMLAEMVVTQSDCGKIGDPTALPLTAPTTSTNGHADESEVSSSSNGTANGTSSVPKPAGASAQGAAGGRTNVIQTGVKDLPKASDRLTNGKPRAAASKNEGVNKERIMPISELNPYQNKWTIRARVMNKAPMRTYSNARGDGKLFSVDLCDESGEIRGTAFNQDCDRLQALFEQGEVYYIAKATLKPANRSFNTLKNDYEMTFNSDTIVEAAGEGVGAELPRASFSFVPISEVSEREPGQIVDVIGVVKSINDVQTITGKASNKEFTKRDISLADETSVITVTVWGDLAKHFDAPNFPVYAFKGVKIGDFHGRSLSSMNTSLILADPAIEEAYRLRTWWDNEGCHKDDFVDLSKGGDAGNRSAVFKTIAQSQAEGLGTGDKPDYFNLKAIVLFIKRDNAVYQMCPKDGCNKKVVEGGDGTYKCTKCDQSHPNFKWSYMVSMEIADSTGSVWLTAFRSEAQAIINRTAEEFGQLSTSEQDEVLNEAKLRESIFTVRASTDHYMDDRRVRLNCARVQPFNALDHAKRLLSNIEALGAQ